MGAVTAKIQIDATPQQVWDVALNPQRLGDWVTIHRKLNECDEGPARLGFTMVQTMELRGAPLKVSWELISCDEPHLATWEGRGPAGEKAARAYGGATSVPCPPCDASQRNSAMQSRLKTGSL